MLASDNEDSDGMLAHVDKVLSHPFPPPGRTFPPPHPSPPHPSVDPPLSLKENTRLGTVNPKIEERRLQMERNADWKPEMRKRQARGRLSSPSVLLSLSSAQCARPLYALASLASYLPPISRPFSSTVP